MPQKVLLTALHCNAIIIPSRLFRFSLHIHTHPGSSAGKESTCNCRRPQFNSWVGRCPGEGIGYPLQYSWASLVAQTINNLPAVQETWVRSLDWEDSLEEGTTIHSSIPAWRIPMEEPGRLQSMGSQSETTE